MSISSIMNSGVKGMAATQLATQTSANNITNASTVGYTRRSVSVTPDQALLGGAISQRVNEPFIQKRLLSSQASAGEANAERVAVEVLDTVFSEGDGSLGSALDAFQVSVQNLSASPEDAASRQQVLGSAGNLATAFQNASAQLEAARAETNARVVESVAGVNQRLEQIGRVSTEIQRMEVNGQEASDLRDQRDVLINEVAERIPVSVLEQGNGQVSVLVGGQQLVSPEGVVWPLSVGVADDGALRIQKRNAGALIDVTDAVKSGSIGGQLKARAGALAEAQKKLDQLASDVATGYNDVHAAGVGLDGQAGRALFDVGRSLEGAAKAFSVSQDVAGAPTKIAAASNSNALPSDNRNALALSALSAAPLAFGGTTVSEALASLTGWAGSTVQSATQAQQFSNGALEQVQALHESATGVSTDEEMVAMMKYQRSYEASLKVIQIADQMFNDLLQIRG
jgi:flagellar hook-associated protein 1